MNDVVVYVDGAFQHQTKTAGIGLVFVYGNVIKTVSEQVNTTTVNNTELTAILHAIKHLKHTEKPVIINTDSLYALEVLTTSCSIKSNRSLIIDIRKLLAKNSNISLNKVQAHTNDEYNNLADKLAKAVLKRANRNVKSIKK